jgi:alkylation response protein AidB-like acyl-CoA dehydrogenase
MDFSLTDDQQAVRDLARQILSEHCSHERMRALEASGEWYDRELWGVLARARLTSLVLPQSVGGGGLGMLEACLVLEEVGRHLAPVPLLATLILGGMPIAEFGTPAQRRRWLEPVVAGEAILTAALEEPGGRDVLAPRVRAARAGGGWTLAGEKICVPAAHLASVILIPARIEGGAGPSPVGVFLVEPGAPGVTIERQVATNLEPLGRVELCVEVGPDAMLGGPAADGSAIMRWLLERSLLALAATQVGVAEEAMIRTARYVIERKQFGRSIASFQSAQHRVADAYIDVECMRSVVLNAAWRLSAGLPASLQVGAAKWWACVAGDRVTHAAQHLHGGIGADVDYPIHRFFLWSQQLLVTLGGPNQQLARLGAGIVRDYRPGE